MRNVCIDRDGPLVTELATEAAATAADHPAPVPDPSGLLGELASRRDRLVEGWLAVTATGDHHRPLGVVMLVCGGPASPRGSRYSLSWLIVHPGARRQGVGRTLVSHACRRAWDRGADAVWVESRADWHAAIAFWEAVGFRRWEAQAGS